jgi:hypothetical protein
VAKEKKLPPLTKIGHPGLILLLERYEEHEEKQDFIRFLDLLERSLWEK